MKMRKGMNWFKSIFGACLIIGMPGIAGADLNDILLKFRPYITFQEEYTNNLNLTSKNKQDAYIGRVYAGLSYSTLPGSGAQPLTGVTNAAALTWGFTPTLIPEAEKYGIDLSARAGFVYYEKGKASNYLSLAGSLNSWYTWANRLTFRVRDYLLRSDEALEPLYPGALPPQYVSGTFVDLTGLYLPGTQRNRSIWLRNVFSPSVDYLFSKSGVISLSYVNNTYNNESDASQNGQQNTISPKLTYWFDIRNGILFEYFYSNSDLGRSPDFTSQAAHGRYTYRFNPNTSIFGDYVFSTATFDPPGIDYYVNSPSLGIHHPFSPTLSALAQVGYFWQTPERGKGLNGPTLNITLTQISGKTTYNFFVVGGYQYDYLTADNLGFTQFYNIAGTVAHQFMENVTASLTGNVMWDKSKAAPNVALSNAYQKNTLWGVNGNVSYLLLKWLNLSLNLSYRENSSNISGGDYNEFRALVSAEVRYAGQR